MLKCTITYGMLTTGSSNLVDMSVDMLSHKVLSSKPCTVKVEVHDTRSRDVDCTLYTLVTTDKKDAKRPTSMEIIDVIHNCECSFKVKSSRSQDLTKLRPKMRYTDGRNLQIASTERGVVSVTAMLLLPLSAVFE